MAPQGARRRRDQAAARVVTAFAGTPESGGATLTRRAWGRARPVLVYAACWLPLALIYTIVLNVMANGTMPVVVALEAGVTNALGPALLGGAVWWVSGRVPFPERGLSRFVLLHAVLGATYAAAWTAWEYQMMGPEGRARSSDYALWHYVMPWQAVLGLCLYGLIAGVSYAVRGVTRSRDLRLVAERAERLCAQAELAALRAHINPHFLFNTLHSVAQLLRGEPARAESALERLSDLFRYVLRLDRQGVELVTLEDEWRFVQSYLWLEQMRMGERLAVDAVLDDDVLAYAVPPFTLQPLVENAVRHGLAPKREGGTLRIRAREAAGELLLEVSDDGAGADPAALANGTGIGVRAVRQRLAARHGERARTEVEGRAGGGFRVRLTLPAEMVDAR